MTYPTNTYQKTTVNQRRAIDNNGRSVTRPGENYRAGYYSGEATGYVEGRHDEQMRLKEIRANNNASRGLILGLFLAGCVGLVMGATFFLAGQNAEQPDVPEVIVVPSGEATEGVEPQN